MQLSEKTLDESSKALKVFQKKLAQIRHKFYSEAEAIHHKIDSKRAQKLKEMIDTRN